jgi:hypothetical protein
LKVRGFIDRYGDIPYVKAVGSDVVERWFLLLLDCFLEAPNVLVAINFDRKYASSIFAEDATIQQEQGRRWSTDYCKSIRVTERKRHLRSLIGGDLTTTWTVS